MPFTTNNQFELLTEGQADWDTGNNSNWSIAERGYHITKTAGTAVVSGQVCLINSAGYVVPYDCRSRTNQPQLLSYRSVSSGENAMFIAEGSVSSISVWSGHLKIGAPVFVSPVSAGFCVSSYAGADRPVGYAIAVDAIRFNPGQPRVLPELNTEVKSLSPILVNTYSDFDMSLASRGIARSIRIVTSCNAYKVQFFSGSARVSSELLYETLTQSSAVGSVDVRTTNFLDQAMFPWYNTDTASLALVFGRITCQSGSSVGSAAFAVTAVVERFA